MNIESFFLDLDGTLLDTAPDLYSAIEYVAHQHHFPLISYEGFRPSVEAGSRGMIEYSFKITRENPLYPVLLEDFLQYYHDHLGKKTFFFEGMEDFLMNLEKRKIPWGIVTNKPEWLTKPLLAHFNLENRCCAVVCGDTLATRKPDPAPLRYACELAKANPQNSVYVGDTKADITAAKAANMLAIAVTFGYNLHRSSPQTWMADFVAENVQDLQNWLNFR